MSDYDRAYKSGWDDSRMALAQNLRAAAEYASELILTGLALYGAVSVVRGVVRRAAS